MAPARTAAPEASSATNAPASTTDLWGFVRLADTLISKLPGVFTRL